MAHRFFALFACFNLMLSTFLHAEESAYQYMDRLALEAGTDKASSFHNYTQIYSMYFAPLKEKPLKFLEIGLYKGYSAKFWEKYFPQAELHFIDITDKYLEYHSNRSHYHYLDSENIQATTNFANAIGGNFDIILDDGGHTMMQQVNAFRALFPHVKSGGIYIIEDLHTSYWRSFGGKGSFQNPLAGPGTAVHFLQKLVDDLNYTGAVTQCADSNKVPADLKRKLNIYQDQIFAIHFYKSVCIIIKK